MRPLRYALPRLLLSLLPMLLPGVLLAQPGAELLNPSFEEVDGETGLPLGWKPWSLPSFAVYTLATARTGVASALITDESPTSSHGLRCQPVPVEAGRKYQGTVWVKISELKTGGFALYLEFWAGGQRLRDFSVSTNQVGDWVPLKVTAQAPEGATEATVLVYSASASMGTAWFDDATISPAP